MTCGDAEAAVVTRSGDAAGSGVAFVANTGGTADASAFTEGTAGTAGTCGFSALDAAAKVDGVFAATRSRRLGSILGELVISAPPANPMVMAANTVPTPAKKEVVLKAMSVSTFRRQRGRRLGVPACCCISPGASAEVGWNQWRQS